MVNYWLNLYSPETWELATRNRYKQTGFSKKSEKFAKQIKPGDILICYVTKVSRFSGMLKAISNEYFDEERSKELWGDESFPCIVDTEPLVTFDMIHSLPKEEVFKKIQDSDKWRWYLRRSPTLIPEQDAKAIVSLIENQQKEQREYPLNNNITRLSSYNKKKERSRSNAKVNEAEDYMNYIPPIVANILELSKSEGSPAKFEEKTELLFRFLGFNTERLGQGKGNNPDIIVKGYNTSGREVYFIVDCKARKDSNYSISTSDERALADYAKQLFIEVRKRLPDIYILIVSSGFKDSQESSIKRLKNETNIKGVIMITPDYLLKELYKRLNNQLEADQICDDLLDQAK